MSRGRAGAHRVGLVALTVVLLAEAGSARQAPLPVGEGSQRVAQAKPGEIRLMVTDGLRGPLQTVRAEIEKSLGRSLVVQYSESRILQKEIEAGQPFELALVTADVIDSGITKGMMLKDKVDIARIRVGVFQRGGTQMQRVESHDSLRQALLGAKSIRWSANAAAEPSVMNTFRTLSIAEAIKPRLRPTTMGQQNPPTELNGDEYELVINIIGATVRAPLVLLGELPRDLQVPIVVAAGIGAKGDAAAARNIITFLQNPAFTPVLEASRLTR
jgi:hypothetical protein